MSHTSHTFSQQPPHPALMAADTAHLTQHLGHCARACGPLHQMRGAVEMADAFLSSRFVSTLIVLSVVLVAVVSGLDWLLG